MKDGAPHFTFRVRGEFSIFLAVECALRTGVTLGWIGHLGPTEWPPRNFTFFFVGWGTEGVYRSKSRTLNELDQQI